MYTQNPSKRVSLNRATARQWGTWLLFLATAVLVEILVVLYAMSRGVKDQTLLQWSFSFPGTSSNVTLAISPLLHLVPIAVVLTLMSSWAYLKKQLAMRPIEAQRARPSNISKRAKGQKKTLLDRMRSLFIGKRGTAKFGKEIRFRKAHLRSAVIVFAVFSALLLIISFFAYPRELYEIVAGIYADSPSMANFVKSVGAALGSVGSVFSSLNNALLTAAPAFRSFVLSIGIIMRPMATMDNVGKYLVFQNGATWISALIILYYGKYGRRGIWKTKK